MSNEFNIKMNICNDESVIYLRIPHATGRRVVSGIMALVVGFLGIVGIKVEISPETDIRPNTEVPQ